MRETGERESRRVNFGVGGLLAVIRSRFTCGSVPDNRKNENCCEDSWMCSAESAFLLGECEDAEITSSRNRSITNLILKFLLA